jgi:hypothetical protein
LRIPIKSEIRLEHCSTTLERFTVSILLTTQSGKVGQPTTKNVFNFKLIKKIEIM